MWKSFIDYILQNRLNFDDKDLVLKNALKDREVSKDLFNPNKLSDCCGYYTYIWGRNYNFVGFVKCSKCKKICSIKKDNN